jgi:hypothetical protein
MVMRKEGRRMYLYIKMRRYSDGVEDEDEEK